MKRLFLAMLVLVVAACTTNGPPLKELKPSQSQSSIVLNEAISYEEKRGIGVVWKEGLERGIYRPEFEDADGTFFRGPEGCVMQHMGAKSMGPFEGGIWIPKDKVNGTPRLYYYFNYNRADALNAGGVVVAGMLESAKGKIELMKPISDKQFLSAIKISNMD